MRVRLISRLLNFFGILAVLAVLTATPALAEAHEDPPLRIVSFDAEGGAASLIITPEGLSLLVDVGWPSDLPPPRQGGQHNDPSTVDLIVEEARRLGLERIDYLLITHYHLDHVGGVHDLLARMPIGAVIDHGPNREVSTDPPPANSAADLYARYDAAVAHLPRQVARVGDTLTLGSLSLTFVASDAETLATRLPFPGAGRATPHCDTTPDKNQIGGEENQRSIGFVAQFGDTRILNLADLTWNAEKRLVCPENRLGEVDLLMVSHHGSALSTTPLLLEAVAPRVALVANGAHKGGDEAVLKALAAAPSAPVVWQQHFAERSPEANGLGARIANPAVHLDAGHALDVLLWRNRTMRVTNRRNGYSEDYEGSPRSTPRLNSPGSSSDR